MAQAPIMAERYNEREKKYEQYSRVFVKMLSELVSSSHSKVSLAVVKGDSGMNVESSDTIQHNEVLINDQNESIYIAG